MAGTGKRWLVGCGVGCAAAALLGILVTVGGGLLLTRPFDRAVDTQRDLRAELGAREAFVPPADGPDRDRLERFLAVRRELEPLCDTFADVASRFERAEALDRQDEDPSIGEVLRAVGDAMSGATGMAANLGRFMETRNRALLAEGMSLGEYVWIYVLAYNAWLGHPPNAGFGEEGDHDYTSRERRLIRGLLENHARALEEAGRAADAALWREEAARVTTSRTGVPFADGELPVDLDARFAPLRAEFEDLYCPETSSFELGKVSKKGLSFRSD